MALYQKLFTGSLKPIDIRQNSGIDATFLDIDNTTTTYKKIPILKWRDIALKHIPVNAISASCEFELKLEYFSLDYWLESLEVVPSKNLPIVDSVRDNALSRQTKTIDFKQKYNRYNDHAKEIRLVNLYDDSYTITSTTFSSGISPDIALNYPITENLYHNRLPGFIDLLPYLVKGGSLLFGDIKEEIELQILPTLGSNDLIIVKGGYSGSVTYEIKPGTITVNKSQSVTVGTTPVKILDTNTQRYSFYLTNNGDTNIFYNLGSLANSTLNLILKPKHTLIYENGNLTVDGVTQNLILDSRYRLGLPLWVRSESGSNQISIEELSFTS